MKTPQRLACLALVFAWFVLRLAAQPAPTEPQRTIITSDRLEMRNTGVEGHYVFIGNVRITGTNLEVTCDRVEVFSVTQGAARPEAAVADTGNIRRMLATGKVTISQEGRKATCGVAEVLPGEDKIILTEQPVINDVGTGVTMKGSRMTVFRGERYAEIENPEVAGPALPNLGFSPPAADAGATTPATPPPTP